MNDKTTDTMRMSMRQVVDMAPTAPDFPTVPERRGLARPMLAIASGFAAVLLFIGVGTVLLANSGDSTVGDVGGQGAVSSAAPEGADSTIVVVFFEIDSTDPPADAVKQLEARPEVIEALIVNTDAAEAEILRGLRDGGESVGASIEGLLPSVRLRVAGSDETVNGLVKFAAELNDGAHVDVYVGDIGVYPSWSFEGSTTVDEPSPATTTSIATTPYVGVLTQAEIEEAIAATQALIVAIEAEVANINEALKTASADAVEEMRDRLAVAENDRTEAVLQLVELKKRLIAIAESNGR